MSGTALLVVPRAQRDVKFWTALLLLPGATREAGTDATVPTTTHQAPGVATLVEAVVSDLPMRPRGVAVPGGHDAACAGLGAAEAPPVAGLERADQHAAQRGTADDAGATPSGRMVTMAPRAMACTEMGFLTAAHQQCRGYVLPDREPCECDCHSGRGRPRVRRALRRSAQLVDYPAREAQ